jgi:hypothetical protein
MHVSMNYKGIRKTPGAQASGDFDFGALHAAAALRALAIVHGSGGACSGGASRLRALGAADAVNSWALQTSGALRALRGIGAPMRFAGGHGAGKSFI